MNGAFNPRMYKQTHTPPGTRGVDAPPHLGFAVLQYFGNIFHLIDSL